MGFFFSTKIFPTWRKKGGKMVGKLGKTIFPPGFSLIKTPFSHHVFPTYTGKNWWGKKKYCVTYIKIAYKCRHFRQLFSPITQHYVPESTQRNVEGSSLFLPIEFNMSNYRDFPQYLKIPLYKT